MIFEYSQMQYLRDWYESHPFLQALIIIGFIALLIIASYFSRHLDKWEEKKQQLPKRK